MAIVHDKYSPWLGFIVDGPVPEHRPGKEGVEVRCALPTYGIVDEDDAILHDRRIKLMPGTFH